MDLAVVVVDRGGLHNREWLAVFVARAEVA